MESFHGNEKYIASPELMQSVNIAMALQKPLLIKGEPGRCWQTRYVKL